MNYEGPNYVYNIMTFGIVAFILFVIFVDKVFGDDDDFDGDF